MKYQENSNAVTLFFSGRVDTTSAPAVEAEAMEILNQNAGKEIIVDAGELEYISSSGLRIIMRMAKRGVPMQVINTSREVYEVFEMTGFTSILPVKQALRRYSVEGCTVIGQGAVGTVYRYDPETIIKVYREGTPLEELEKERERAQLAFVNGIPTAISYNIVQVGDCYGLVYELIDSRSLGNLITANPEKAEEYAVLLAKVLKQVHAIDASDMDLTYAADSYVKAAKNMEFVMEPDEYDFVLKWIDAMPRAQVMIHGDFHPQNIMMQDGEPLLIDMGDIGIGHPLYDIAITYFVIFCLSPERAAKISGVPQSCARQFWQKFASAYTGIEDEEKLARFEEIVYSAAYLRAAIVQGISSSFTREAKAQRVAELRERIFPRKEEMLRALANAGEFFNC